MSIILTTPPVILSILSILTEMTKLINLIKLHINRTISYGPNYNQIDKIDKITEGQDEDLRIILTTPTVILSILSILTEMTKLTKLHIEPYHMAQILTKWTK